MYLLQILIGLLQCVLCYWLVLVIRHSIGNRCVDNVIFIVHSLTVQVTVTSSCVGLWLQQTSASGIILSNTAKDNKGYSYQSNLDWQWSLVSASIVKLELPYLHFHIFNTQLDADFLYVYDGDSSSSSLIDKFSGTSLPSPITSSSNKLHLRFTSDGSNQARGFTAG